MNRQRSLVTFLFALTGFLAIGAGVVLLVTPDPGGALLRRAGGPAAGADTDGTTGTTNPSSGEPTAGPAGLPLLAGAVSIPRPGQPSRIIIPSIALDAPVVEVGIVMEKGKPVWETAAFAVGHHRGTALPGTRGNAVMAGHISSPVSKKGEVVRRLPEVRIGDRVDIYVDGGRVTYEVTAIRVVAPAAVEVLNPTPDATLTLITCYPDYSYKNRLIVTGKLVGQPA